MDMVRAVNLKKYYIADTYEVRALDGVSLTAEEGEFLAVVGTSGSGKTTLLNLLGGLDVPDSGGVWIRGSSLKDMDREERTVFRRRNIGFVFQQYNLIPSLSVYECRSGWTDRVWMKAFLRRSRIFWDFRINWTDCRAPFPAVSSRGQPSQEPCCPGRLSCWRMSLPAAWTQLPAWK